MFGKLYNGVVIDYPVDPYMDHPEANLPTDFAGGLVGEDEYVVVQYVNPPEGMQPNQRFIEDWPEQDENGAWRMKWVESPYSAEELEQLEFSRMSQWRIERNLRLAAWDWMFLSDNNSDPTLKTAISTYRQQLRDMFNDPNFNVWQEPMLFPELPTIATGVNRDLTSNAEEM